MALLVRLLLEGVGLVALNSVSVGVPPALVRALKALACFVAFSSFSLSTLLPFFVFVLASSPPLVPDSVPLLLFRSPAARFKASLPSILFLCFQTIAINIPLFYVATNLLLSILSLPLPILYNYYSFSLSRLLSLYFASYSTLVILTLEANVNWILDTSPPFTKQNRFTVQYLSTLFNTPTTHAPLSVSGSPKDSELLDLLNQQLKSTTTTTTTHSVPTLKLLLSVKYYLKSSPNYTLFYDLKVWDPLLNSCLSIVDKLESCLLYTPQDPSPGLVDDTPVPTSPTKLKTVSYKPPSKKSWLDSVMDLVFPEDLQSIKDSTPDNKNGLPELLVSSPDPTSTFSNVLGSNVLGYVAEKLNVVEKKEVPGQFKELEELVLSVEIITTLLLASTTQDKYGRIHTYLPEILESFCACLIALETSFKGYEGNVSDRVMKERYYLVQVFQNVLYRIVVTYFDNLENYKVSKVVKDKVLKFVLFEEP
ncbi:hypothetical protein HK098_001745 [Nowakowskiella sp. JEL0407]|nr:hypothetical protein HK098_001745 [Nowakowskiella sp. JEL0407]